MQADAERAVMTDGKKPRPMQYRLLCGGQLRETRASRPDAAPGCSRGTRRRAWTPAAGARCAVRQPAGTPCATARGRGLPGSEADSPTIIRVKKIPIDSTWAEFWKVVFMPGPRPAVLAAGRLFMTAARFGEPNDAITSPVTEQQDREHPVRRS